MYRNPLTTNQRRQHSVKTVPAMALKRYLLALILGAAAWAQSPDVTITGKIQGPNGLPVANNIISLTPTQQFFVAGSGGSTVCNSYIIEIAGTALTCGDTINFNATTPAAPTNGYNVTFAKSTTAGVDSVSAAVVGDGNAAHFFNGTGAFSAVSGGLPSTVVYVSPGSSSATIQSVLSAATAGTEIWFSGSNTGCSLTLSAASVRLRGLDTAGTSISCATPGVPILTVSGNGDEVYGITFSHITTAPTCPGGNGTSTCGDGLQIAGGANRVKVADIHTNFNYNGITLGWTTYGEFSNSVSEFNQNHGVAFVMSASNKNMQWQVSRILSEQNLGNGFDMTCPASFTSVQTPGIYGTGWLAAFGNVGYGYNFSCSAATTSGIADIWLDGAFASQNNNSGFHIDLGPNGGRNFIGVGLYSEQAGTYTGTAGFAQASQSATNVGYGIEITSSCDPTIAPNISGGTLWGNSYSGAITACAGTSFSNVSTDNNGAAAASAQTEAGITINAAQVSVNAGFHKKSTNENYGTYVLSGDTPSVIGTTCDSGIGTANCTFTASSPTNGYQQQLGQSRVLTGSGAPSMNCSAGWIYLNSTAAGASTAEYTCGPANTWTAVVGLPASPQTGDTVCYNCNGDNAWDSVNYARAILGMYAVAQTPNLTANGYSGSGSVTPTGSCSSVNATATVQGSTLCSASATGSLNTVIGANCCENGSVSEVTMQAIYRFSARLQINDLSGTVRYWHGLACRNSGGTGNNGTAIVGTTAYAADIPNKSTLGFRYSSTTDTHWQAIAIIAGASVPTDTIVDTGITPDTNVHLFEMAMNAAGTSVNYFIDSVLVATIATNIPLASSGGNGNGDIFFTGDNKNTATAVSETFYSMQLSLKL